MVRNTKENGLRVALIAGDVALAAATLLIVTALRYGSDWTLASTYWPHLLAFAAIFAFNLVTHYAFGLYDSVQRPTDAEVFMACLRSQALATVFGAVLFYFVAPQLNGLEPRRVLLGFAFGLLPLTWLWHVTSRRLLYRAVPALRVLVLGQGDRAQRLARELNSATYLGYQVAALVPSDGAAITQAIEQHQPDVVVNALEGSITQDALASLRRCLSEHRPVISLAAFTEQVLRKVPVEDVDHWWFIENFSLRRRPLYEAGKRVSDIIISVTLMAATLPLLPFIALAVKSTPGPLFFKQQRTGRHGRSFMAMKFRSMVADAEANGPQWSSRNDSRITRSGKFLRATRLDEIPQLVNILRGDMSFVGPRPERPEFIDKLQEEIPFYQERHLVKPGLTGWAQINYPYGDSVEDALEKLRYDLYYIKNRSLMLDVSTVLKTVNTVLRGLGR